MWSLQLAGLPPVYGLYTGFPAAIYAVFGSSRHAAIGPQSIPALLIASGISGITPEPTAAEYIGYVMSVSLISGCLMLLMGWLNLGFIIRFISRPVLAGFISASAILTICSTAKVCAPRVVYCMGGWLRVMMKSRGGRAAARALPSACAQRVFARPQFATCRICWVPRCHAVSTFMTTCTALRRRCP
ncbi:MAG: hypothetical protein EOO41_01095, partial [Methanobacteriota archaeon]